MHISLDDDVITDDNDTEDIISESQPHDYTSDNIINTHQLSTGMCMSLFCCIEELKNMSLCDEYNYPYCQYNFVVLSILSLAGYYLLYHYIVSQTSGTGNTSNTTQDTNTSSVQGIFSVCIYTCN